MALRVDALPLDVGAEVADAVGAGLPVVALESTIVGHGFPRPDDLTAAVAVEDQLRAAGVVPAPVAVLDGRLAAGLSAARLTSPPPCQFPRLPGETGTPQPELWLSGAGYG